MSCFREELKARLRRPVFWVVLVMTAVVGFLLGHVVAHGWNW